MKARIALITTSAAACTLLASCGGGNQGGSLTNMPPPPQPQVLDTAAVLSIVQTMTSETAAPFEVDNQAVELVGADDQTGSPISVDAT